MLYEYLDTWLALVAARYLSHTQSQSCCEPWPSAVHSRGVRVDRGRGQEASGFWVNTVDR